MTRRSIQTQFARYAVVGLVSNGVLYAAYLVLTHFGVEPKVAMTLTFALGVIQTFLMNRGWTFSYHGSNSRACVRYGVAYGGAYVLNFLLLVLFVDRLGFPHQVVQAVLILGVAVLLFVTQRYWVFAELPLESR